MATETERKYLVGGEFIEQAVSKTEILQRYLTIDPDKTVRLRIAGNEAFLTIKGRSPEGTLTRGEWEFLIPVGEAHEIMSLCLPGKIVKTRYIVPYAGHTFEVDVFHGENEGLIIAEIELSDENEVFEKPGWLGQEVTGLQEFYNANLIK